jgi:hypothetical protein
MGRAEGRGPRGAESAAPGTEAPPALPRPTDEPPAPALHAGLGRSLVAVLLAWLAMLAVDFFVHAGLLSRFYVAPPPAVLPPQEAARLIPVGYASFLLWAVLLEILVLRFRAAGAWRGFLAGLGFGALIQGATYLGLATITTLPRPLLAGWFAAQTAQFAAGGLVAGSALAGARLGPLLLRVLAFAGLLFLITVVLQSAGLAPAVKVPGP